MIQVRCLNKWLRKKLISPLLRALELETESFSMPSIGVDIAIGFGIGLRKDGSPSSLSEAVAWACAMLYTRGLVKRIVFTGGNPENGINEAEAMVLIAQRQGVPESKILIENHSSNTRQNARNTLALLKGEGFAGSLVCVSHRLHSRCYRALRRIIPEDYKVFWLGVDSGFDKHCTQIRLRDKRLFVLWELVWNVVFKVCRWA